MAASVNSAVTLTRGGLIDNALARRFLDLNGRKGPCTSKRRTNIEEVLDMIICPVEVVMSMTGSEIAI